MAGTEHDTDEWECVTCGKTFMAPEGEGNECSECAEELDDGWGDDTDE